MTRRQSRQDRGYRGVFRALLIASALLLPASAFAAAPPSQFKPSIHTDRFRPLPADWLQIIRDGPRIAEGGVEFDIYAQVIARASCTSQAAFKKAVHLKLTYTHLIDDANRHRGKAVRIEGRLMKINRFNPPVEAAVAGVNDLYEAWVITDKLAANPYCVVFTHWPEGLPRSLLRKPKITDIVRVEVAGYFFKTFNYKAAERKRTERSAPILVAHSLVLLSKATSTEDEPRGLFQNLQYAFIGMLGVLFFGFLNVTCWFRRNDNLVRRRLMAQAPEFALPPPDAPLTRSIAGIHRAAPMTSHITFPASGKGDGQRGDGPASKEGKPSDEGAGA